MTVVGQQIDVPILAEMPVMMRPLEAASGRGFRTAASDEEAAMTDFEPVSSVAPDKTTFRVLMARLLARTGGLPEWPLVLHALLSMEFERQRDLGIAYAGEVFKDRDADDPTLASLPEKRRVRDLFHLCHRESGGRLLIGTSAYWLLGYEWPNQGGEKGRRADLVGLNPSGGLVVFECKLDDNSYGPFAAVLEGLDYLACLTSEANFRRIQERFSSWAKKPGRVVPSGFERTAPDRSSRPEVVVMAPAAYYGLYSRSGRGIGWNLFAEWSASAPGPVAVAFAQSDFNSTAAAWITTGPTP